jgi:hypothetical protein
MMATHELGHVLAGWFTGGTVTKVILHPLSISRTDVSPNPRPGIVVWAGALAGVGLPLLIWAGFRILGIAGSYLPRFFAGFCMIANGAYIAAGSLGRIGDAGEMLRHGAPAWLLWLFGAVTMPLGIMMWHGLGHWFGFGEARGRVDVRAAYFSLILFLLVVALEFAWSPRI